MKNAMILFMSLYSPSLVDVNHAHVLSTNVPFHSRYPAWPLGATLTIIIYHLLGRNSAVLPLVGRGAGDVEPLVDAGVDGSGCLVLALGDVELAGVGAVGRVRDGGVGPEILLVTVTGGSGIDVQVDLVLGGLASGKLLPGLSALADNVHGVLLVLALAGEGELVLGLAVWDLVDAEPLVRGAEKTGEVALDILDVVELGGQWVVHVDDHDLPVGLALVEQSHDTEDLDLDDIAGLVDELTNLADVQRVVVALGLGLLMGNIGVLPCL
jgi:hypothetical protein